MPEGQKTALITQLRQMREGLQAPPPFSPSERKVIQTMNENRKPFVEKSLTYGEKVPDILPRFVNIDELRMDLATFSDYADTPVGADSQSGPVVKRRNPATARFYPVIFQIKLPYNALKTSRLLFPFPEISMHPSNF